MAGRKKKRLLVEYTSVKPKEIGGLMLSDFKKKYFNNRAELDHFIETSEDIDRSKLVEQSQLIGNKYHWFKAGLL